jgi:dihydroorotate dehydrogenase (fumarate)
LSETLRWVSLVSGLVKGISVSASTGVHDSAGVIKCLLAGATTVQLCSLVYQHGPSVLRRILGEMQTWMDEKHFDSVDNFRGRLSFDSSHDAEKFERSQFMKSFGGFN